MLKLIIDYSATKLMAYALEMYEKALKIKAVLRSSMVRLLLTFIKIISDTFIFVNIYFG